MRTFFLLLFISFNAFGMQAKIRCDQLEGTTICYMARQGSNFMDINGGNIYFYHGDRCYENTCDWVGTISPNILKEGINHANFNVKTLTDNPKEYSKQKFSFYFGGSYKDSLVSTRNGFEVDKAEMSFYLTLEEIDPALYNEYIQLKDQFDLSLGRGENPELMYDDLVEASKKIDDEINDLSALANSIKDKQFDEIDAETLAKLGIAENQIRLLRARKDELLQFSNRAEQTRAQVQAQVIARYEAVRARAKTYDSNLPDLPVRPNKIDPRQYEISAFVTELNNELNSIIVKIDEANASKNFKLYREALQEWKRASDHSISLYTQSADINASEKELLYHSIYEGSLKIFNDGNHNDGWKKTNAISEDIRNAIDELADKNVEEASELRNTLNFTKINPAIETEVKLSMAKAQKLSEKLKNYEAKTDIQKNAKNIASATLRVSLSSIDEAVKSGKKDSLSFADEAAEIGLLVLDIGIDFVPGISTARSAVELFTGKNIVTGEEFGPVEYSMAFVGLFVGLRGFNAAKVAFEPATELISKIGNKLKLPWTKTAKEVSESLPQVENLLEYYKKLKKPIVEITSSEAVNKLISEKYYRLKDKSFFGSKVIRRLTEDRELYCRVIKKATYIKYNSITNPEGGLYVMRCSDLAKMTALSEVIEKWAIPNMLPADEVVIAKFISPSLIETFEGVVAPLYKKTGGAIQIFLNTTDEKTLKTIDKNAIVKDFADAFKSL